ncbi:hypothetical protein FGB62_137g01 [Gracilaria domingensis]|nr:hypothetical protein FGB62_137g01 [Gracilaria domingensis]
MAAASVSDTIKAIDTTLCQSGAPFSHYSCKTISWDDVSRGTIGESLSCWGANITDTYLKAKDGTPLFTVRPDNWNEKLGVVRATDVALLIGNCSVRSGSDDDHLLRNITLQQFLQKPAACGAAYAASLSPDVTLDAPERDVKVSIRFQTVFLPVARSEGARETMEFATEAYNYNTKSDDDPRNLVLLATTQGLAVQADGAGKKRLLHHARDPSSRVVWQHWLQAERSDHAVGGAQEESEEERKDALQRDKATADVLGIKAMGKRFNTLMTVQIPLMTTREPQIPAIAKMQRVALCVNRSSKSRGRHRATMPLGCSNAARVSLGTRHSVFTRLKIRTPRRNKDEHVTVTVVFYNTVTGGVPAAEDVIAAVEDMERLLGACSESGRLADAAFDFMKEELKVSDMIQIADKLTNQPPRLPPS